MSVVAVRVEKDKLCFSSDSIGVKGQTKSKNLSKLETINGLTIGGVGTAEETSLLFLFAKTHQPANPDEHSVLEFMFEFYKWKSSLNLGFDTNGEYIIGFGGRAFFVERLLVKEVVDYYAIGAGRDYALAILWSGKSAKEAVKAACELCCYVSEPIKCVEIVRGEVA